MTFRMETAEQFARRANIAKYQKILAKFLTTDERRFVELRIAEEQAALQQLAGRTGNETTYAA